MGEMFYNYSYLKPINHFIAKNKAMFFGCLDIAKDFNKSRMKNDHKIMII